MFPAMYQNIRNSRPNLVLVVAADDSERLLFEHWLIFPTLL